MKLLTSDRFFVLTYLFWMAGGLAPLLPGVALLFNIDRIVTKEGLITLLIFLSSCGISFGLFLLGGRERNVSLSDQGEVFVHWGIKFPLILRRYNARDLKDFTTAREARFLVTTSGTGMYVARRGNLADRWRLTATYKGKKVNLGSYTTEQEAKEAIRLIQR